MKNLEHFKELELNINELKDIDGGIFPFLIGYAVGVILGAGGVVVGYHIAKHND